MVHPLSDKWYIMVVVWLTPRQSCLMVHSRAMVSSAKGFSSLISKTTLLPSLVSLFETSNPFGHLQCLITSFCLAGWFS